MTLKAVFDGATVAIRMGDDTAEAARQATRAAGSATAAAQSAQAALAAARYYPTIAAGVAATSAGQMFTSDEGGTWNYYLRTAASPFFALFRRVLALDASGTELHAPNFIIDADAGTAGFLDGSANIQFFNATGNGVIEKGILLNTDGQTRLYVNSAGRIGIGTETPEARVAIRAPGSNGLFVESTGAASCLALRKDNTAGAFAIFQFGGSDVGSITTNGSTTSYNTTSDERLKEDIADAGDAGNLLDQITVRSFNWKSTEQFEPFGMIAQELIEVVPRAVYVPEDPDAMMAIDYSKLVPLLVKEVQSLRARLAALEAVTA